MFRYVFLIVYWAVAVMARADESGYGFIPPSLEAMASRYHPSDLKSVPYSEWNWNHDEDPAQDRVTPARNQGACECCWAFAITGVVESQILIKYQEYFRVSPQYLVSCDEGNDGCCGGEVDGFEFLMARGIVPESGFPFGYGDAFGPRDCPRLVTDWQEITTIPCPFPPPVASRFAIDDYFYTGSSDDALKNALIHEGPLYVWFDVYQDFPNYWLNGSTIYHHAFGDTIGSHAVVLIGFSDSRGCWILKNSEGPTWGPYHDGTFEIAYGDHCGFSGGYYCEVGRPNEFQFMQTATGDVAQNGRFDVAGHHFWVTSVNSSSQPPRVTIRDESGDQEQVATGTFEHWADYDVGIWCNGIFQENGQWVAMLRGYQQITGGPAPASGIIKGAPGDRVRVIAYPGSGHRFADGSNELLSTDDGHNFGDYELNIDAQDDGTWAEIEVDIPSDASLTSENVLVGSRYADNGAKHLNRMRLIVCRPPGAVTNLTFNPENPNSDGDWVTLSWSSVAGADQYQVLLDGAAVGDPVSSPPVSFNVHSGIYCVVARNECGSTASAGVPMLIDQGPPGPVEIIYFTN